jgi:Undecaprenyl-phosphate galactose phosphotransferase WbaP
MQEGSALKNSYGSEGSANSAYPAAKADARLTVLPSANSLRNDKESTRAIPHEFVQEQFGFGVQLRGFIFCDAFALILGLLCAWTMAALINSVSFDRHNLSGLTKESVSQILHSSLIGVCVILWFMHTGHYQVRMPFWMEAKKVVEASAFAMLIDGFLRFASKHDFSRIWLISNWVFAALGILLLRALWRRVLRHRGTWQIPTLLIGNGPTADDARGALASEPGLGYNIISQISDLAHAFQQAGSSWQALCQQHKARYILIALDGHDIMNAGSPLAQLMREPIPFSVSPPLQNLPVLGMVPQYFFNHDVMLLTRSHGLDQPLQRFFKRTFDIITASVALAVFSPVFLALYAMVKMDGGPAFFAHKRLGLNGKAFRCLKFRSMVTNGDAVLSKTLAENPAARDEWQRDHKLRNDPRITFIGGILRRTSLDELPQIINVLRGDMSVVGPRPIILAETKKYNNDISHYYRVRPGITGLWQVSGRNDVSYAQRVQMDSWYVRNWSLWHDIAIICKTIPVIINRNGAY